MLGKVKGVGVVCREGSLLLVERYSGAAHELRAARSDTAEHRAGPVRISPAKPDHHHRYRQHGESSPACFNSLSHPALFITTGNRMSLLGTCHTAGFNLFSLIRPEMLSTHGRNDMAGTPFIGIVSKVDLRCTH